MSWIEFCDISAVAQRLSQRYTRRARLQNYMVSMMFKETHYYNMPWCTVQTRYLYTVVHSYVSVLFRPN